MLTRINVIEEPKWKVERKKKFFKLFSILQRDKRQKLYSTAVQYVHKINTNYGKAKHDG